jgi:RNA polymerase sigma factor (sigma-70 family)
MARWLIVTTRHLCLDHYSRARALARAGSLVEAPAVPSEADLMERLEMVQEVREALEGLPARCREVLWTLYFEQDVPDYRAASERLGMPVGSIGPTRGRCLQRLLRRLRLARASESR